MQGSVASSHLALQMKKHVHSKKRRLPLYRLSRSVRKNSVIVVSFACLITICLMIGIQIGHMLVDDDDYEHAARGGALRKQEPLLYYDTQNGPQEVLRPYEQQWGLHLPNDMKKDANKYHQSVSKDKEVCLVNVGQAAESIACALGFKMGCKSKSNHDLPVGLLPHHTTHMFRQNVYDCFEDSAYYLFLLRNPLDRLILAFENSRSGNLYANCQYDTIGHLVNMGLSTSGSTNATCKDLAVASVEGAKGSGMDLYFNYQYYLEGIPFNSNIMAIRSEHAFEDWSSIESSIGGSKDVLRGMEALLNDNEKDELWTTVDEQSRELLCRHLCNEIQVYKKILSVSVNLNEKQTQEALEGLKDSCPVEATVSLCDSPLPDITQKLYESRGYSRDQTLDRHTNQIVVGRSMHPSPPSPFEMLWPALKLPHYMSKDRHYDIESVPADKRACFVHVGKTAGSTVGCSIGFNLHCSSKVQAPGLFPQYATNMFHSQMYDCDDDSAFFIFVVRHPLDRWISAFNYDNPSKDWEGYRRQFGEKHFNFRHKLYAECPFKTVNDIGEAMSADSNITDVCKKRAAASIDGTEHFGCHHYFNYQFHLEAIPKNATIMTLRTEHLREDWNSVEYNLGGEKEVLGEDNHVIAHNNVNKAGGYNLKYLSDKSRVLICAKLCNEIQNYKKILQLSVNLSEEQVQESIDEVMHSCPIEALTTTCHDPMPNITQKLYESRGYMK